MIATTAQAKAPPLRQKKCGVCRAPFTPIRPLQRVCGFACACVMVEKAAAKRSAKESAIERAKDRIAKERIKSRSAWMKEAQAAVNRYVRQRDADKPCISCGRFHEGQWHAGHYRSVGSAPHLRFDADRNIFKQCAPCNNHLSGNIINYRIGLIQRIGQQAVDELESDQSTKKYTIDELREIKRIYNEKHKAISERR